jgi:hypothetical protein
MLLGNSVILCYIILCDLQMVLYRYRILVLSAMLIFACTCRLSVDEGGLTALVRLSNGDMRKALNILQVIP